MFGDYFTNIVINSTNALDWVIISDSDVPPACFGTYRAIINEYKIIRIYQDSVLHIIKATVKVKVHPVACLDGTNFLHFNDYVTFKPGFISLMM